MPSKNPKTNHGRDLHLLRAEGFKDVSSMIRKFHSAIAEVRETKKDYESLEEDYESLVRKMIELEERLTKAHGVIVEQAIQIHSLKENTNV